MAFNVAHVFRESPLLRTTRVVRYACREDNGLLKYVGPPHTRLSRFCPRCSALHTYKTCLFGERRMQQILDTLPIKHQGEKG